MEVVLLGFIIGMMFFVVGYFTYLGIRYPTLTRHLPTSAPLMIQEVYGKKART